MKKKSASPNFGKIMDEWLLYQSGRVKPTTHAAYETVVRRHLKPEFGENYPQEITNQAVETFRRKLLARGLAPSTVRTVLSVLRSAVRFGRRYGCAASDEDFPRAPGGARAPVPVMSPAEQQRLLQVLPQTGDRRALGVLICMYTGLRVGEICGLRWGDVAPDCRSLTVWRTVTRICRNGATELYVGEPKSFASRRRIPLPETLTNVLHHYRMPDDCYIVSNSPDKIVEPRSMQRFFHSVQRSAGVEQVNFHALRHTFATRCVELGFDPKALSMILGHASVSITLNTYVHPSFERLRGMMHLLDH